MEWDISGKMVIIFTVISDKYVGNIGDRNDLAHFFQDLIIDILWVH
jgi:hypothetical protein